MYCKVIQLYTLCGSMIKNLPTNAGDTGNIQFLGQEDPLEKEMATHSSLFAWETPWTEEPGSLKSMRMQRVRHNLAIKQQQPVTHTYTHTHTHNFQIIFHYCYYKILSIILCAIK